jgi:hypothetical protein
MNTLKEMLLLEKRKSPFNQVTSEYDNEKLYNNK